MKKIGPKSARDRTTERVFVAHDSRNYPLVLTPRGWRLRSRKKKFPADFRTGTTNLHEAKKRAKAWLEERSRGLTINRKGGGNLEALATIYTDTPKRASDEVAADNISRLRSICRLALGKELVAVTCREVGPAFWQNYQRKALERAGHKFDLTTRHRENIGINSAVRAARSLFIPAMLVAYREAGLDVPDNAAQAVMLLEPYLAKEKADDAELLKAWAALRESDLRMWLVIGIARFAGLRRDEISAARLGWVEVEGAAVYLAMHDRPEEKFWIKGRKPYRAQVIAPDLAEWLVSAASHGPADALIVPDPAIPRDRWFERVPQEWVTSHGITARQPLHRLRALYADAVAKLTADAIAIRLGAVKAAQENLGHTTPSTTERHYLS